MSITYDLICHDCKEYAWIGQGLYIYKTEKHLKLLEQFLFKHEEHNLCFAHEGFEEDYDDYTEFLGGKK